MKKIMILANHATGLYKFRKELLKEFINQDYEVIAVLPTDNDNIEYIKQIGVKVIHIDIDRRGINPLKDLKIVKQYLKLTKELKPDVILTYTIKPNIYGGIVARIRKIPSICNITGIGTALQEEGFLKKILVTLYKIALKNAKCVFFQNESNKKMFEDLKMVKQEKSILIPGSGVNLEENMYEEYPEADVQKIIFVGRIMKEKGIDEFLEMTRKIKEKNQNVEFEIFGDYEEENYKKLIEEYEQNGIIKYYGHQNGMHEFFKRASCLVQPSYHEGTSNVLLEASAIGRPVIASNIPGCKEIIDNNETGYVFEVKNAEDLAEKVQKFIDLSLLEKIEMGKKARLKVEKEFDRKIVINAYLKEIKTILN